MRLTSPLRHAAVLAAGLVLLLTPSFARADSSSTLTVVGTGALSDSGVISNLIGPAFHAAAPQYSFRYVGAATGAAITAAENGSAGASVLIADAPSLENQFVAGGYSTERYGRTIMSDDLVLAGSSADPAGVGANGAHNIAQAFADIATAGYHGGSGTPTATFVSSGGTYGATVAEHQIWALVASAGLTPSGVTLCAVPSALGGGETPITYGSVSQGAACPGGVLPGQSGGGNLPAWYVVTGDGAAATLVATNACTAAGGPSGVTSPAGSCYTLADRGTYDDELSGASPAGGTDQIADLAILTHLNGATAPGGTGALANPFHAYLISATRSPSAVNSAAAQAFVSFLTSSSVQSALNSYLNDTSDASGAPYVPAAAPAITATGIPTSATAGQSVTVTGAVSNPVAGFAVPANQTVNVSELVGGTPTTVASGQTSATGAYSVTFSPPSSGSYEVTTGTLALVENTTLSPVFGDLLSPGASAATALGLQATASIGRVTTSAGTVTAQGVVGPAAPDGSATATLLARAQSSTGAFRVIGVDTVNQGQSTYSASGSLRGGRWTIEVRYSDPGGFTATTTAPRNVTVAAGAVALRFSGVRLTRDGRTTVRGRLAQGPTTTPATVRLYALALGSPGARFRQVARTRVRTGAVRFTLRHRFARGHRYALQLQYLHRGQTTTYSAYRYLTVR